MFVVDTNVLVYAANKDSPEHQQCREAVETWRRQTTPWYLTWGIVYEFLRITTHPSVLSKPWSLKSSWKFIGAILVSKSVGILIETDRHENILSELINEIPALSGNMLHDAHTAALMREHGIGKVVTRDTDFHRFKFLEVVDPLTES